MRRAPRVSLKYCEARNVNYTSAHKRKILIHCKFVPENIHGTKSSRSSWTRRDRRPSAGAGRPGRSALPKNVGTAVSYRVAHTPRRRRPQVISRKRVLVKNSRKVDSNHL
ncbi:hypothetical protein EVAR_24222_1 [Eumeta japonica]|uniref:Uncharacterized protein n=1 Tax=Eumeta variegata TaxID=151549 RepID=A0A4C1W675_EUMVA|nr:hypothetical protein EVAR_24222_1 [Eumeta japonica]